MAIFEYGVLRDAMHRHDEWIKRILLLIGFPFLMPPKGYHLM